MATASEVSRAQRPLFSGSFYVKQVVDKLCTPSCLHMPLAKAVEKAGVDVRVAPQVLIRTFWSMLVYTVEPGQTSRDPHDRPGSDPAQHHWLCLDKCLKFLQTFQRVTDAV